MALKDVKFVWNLKETPQRLWDLTDNLIVKIRNAYDKVASVPPNEISFENFLKVIADIERDFYTEFYFCKFMQHVSSDKELRSASNEAEKKLSEFLLEIDMRKDLFQKLLILESKQLDLSDEAAHYLSKSLRRRKHNGLHLPEGVQSEIKILQEKINDLRTQYNKNITEDTTFIELTDEELTGLDNDFISALIKNPDTLKRKVTMKYPDYIPAVTKVKNPEIRKKLYFTYNSRVKQNIPIIEEIGTLRHKLAKLMGFNTYSDYNADILMVKSADNIKKFLNGLSEKLLPVWEQEKKYMLELKKAEHTNENMPFDGKLDLWDINYYSNKVKEIKYSVNDDEIKEYFPLPFVTKAIFNIYERIFGLTFQKVENIEIWHPDVETFSVTDNETQKLLGYFFMDLFPREGKFSHYAVQEVQPGCLNANGTRMIGVVALLANFPKPTPEKPSLLPHNDVVTYFHEFGHVMHYICNQADFVEFSGIRVEMDFVEAPSQMLENWCWIPEVIKMLSSHYIRGDPLPDEMISALIKTKIANVGYLNLKQISFGLIDQKLHTSEKLDTAKAMNDIIQELMGLKGMEGINFCATFPHIAEDYPAAYFCYKWTEVFSIDMFETRFGEKGALDPKLGKEYREKILKPGGTKDPMDLLKNFLGREPNQNAFFRFYGLPVDAN